MKIIFKKLILSIAIIILLGFTVLYSNSFAQEFLSDLEHLDRGTTFPGIVYETVEVPGAWNEIRTALGDGQIDNLSSVKVGIIDTGIDAGHPEFSTLVDFGNTPPFAKFDSEREGHGTQIAGIIGANNIISSGETLESDSPQMNGILSGVSELSYVLEVRKGGAFEISGRFLNAFSVANRVDNLIENDVDVINMSFGGVPLASPLSSSIVNYFEKTFTSDASKKVLFVVGAGNEDINANLVSPANLGNDLENVITVGGSSGINRWPDSNFGDAVNISAPADFIYAPVPRGQGELPESGPEQNNYSDQVAGTSFSAPFVTGVAGLLKAINSNLTPGEIKDILISTADPITTDKPIGPRLNAERAVQAVLPSSEPPSLDLILTPNPATPIDSCLGASPAWSYSVFITNTSSTPIDITNFTWDFFDSGGAFINRQTDTPQTFAQFFNSCAPGSSTISPNTTMCGGLCVHLGGRLSGSVTMTFNAVDDFGRSVSASETVELPEATFVPQFLQQQEQYTDAGGGSSD